MTGTEAEGAERREVTSWRSCEVLWDMARMLGFIASETELVLGRAGPTRLMFRRWVVG